MLDRAAMQIFPRHRQRRRLGRTGGKNHIRPLRTKRRRHLCPRPCHNPQRRAPLEMHAGRVAHHIHRRNHRRTRLIAQRRCRVPIQICPLHSAAPLSSSFHKYLRRRLRARAPQGCAPGVTRVARHKPYLSSTTSNRFGTAGQGASSLAITSDRRVWCKNT